MDPQRLHSWLNSVIDSFSNRRIISDGIAATLLVKAMSVKTPVSIIAKTLYAETPGSILAKTLYVETPVSTLVKTTTSAGTLAGISAKTMNVASPVRKRITFATSILPYHHTLWKTCRELWPCSNPNSSQSRRDDANKSSRLAFASANLASAKTSSAPDDPDEDQHAYFALGAAAYGSNELSYRLDSDGFSD